MTHTHHRRGSRESLSTDYVLLAMIDPAVEEQQKYRGALAPRVKKLLSILGRHDPVSLAARTPQNRLRYMKGWEPSMDSGIHQSSTVNDIVTCEDIEGIGHAVYTSKQSVEKALQEIREADLGISIVVSGVFEEVFDICRRTGLTPHTVNMSLETWGKTDLLPKGSVLELCTMCGHAMISARLAETMISQVIRGIKTPEAAAVELGKQCTCNIFNTARGAEIIKGAAAAREATKS